MRISEQNAAEVRRAFPAEQVEEALGVLSTYGDASWHRETDRVHGAILHLAAGNLDDLRHYADAAYRDYRDVLWWATDPPRD